MRKIVTDQLKDVSIGKRIGAGVANIRYPDRLFFYYGTLLEISKHHLILENKKETVQIPLDDVIIIRKDVY